MVYLLFYLHVQPQTKDRNEYIIRISSCTHGRVLYCYYVVNICKYVCKCMCAFLFCLSIDRANYLPIFLSVLCIYLSGSIHVSSPWLDHICRNTWQINSKYEYCVLHSAYRENMRWKTLNALPMKLFPLIIFLHAI